MNLFVLKVQIYYESRVKQKKKQKLFKSITYLN